MQTSWEDIKLNDVGMNYLNALREQLKNNNLYEDFDDVIRLNDIAIEHQLYIKSRLEAEFDETNKSDLKAQRHRKARDEGLKAVGQGATQRTTLKADRPEKKKKETIFDKVADALKDNGV